MVEHSAEEQAAQGFSSETLETWSWIGRARAAARRAVERELAPPDPTGERPAASRNSGDD